MNTLYSFVGVALLGLITGILWSFARSIGTVIGLLRIIVESHNRGEKYQTERDAFLRAFLAEATPEREEEQR